MKKYLFNFLFLISIPLMISPSAWPVGKIQNEDVKTEAQLVSGGSDKSHLINDSKVYVTANGINDRLDHAILAGQLGGGGGSGIQLLSNPEFENGTTATGWTITSVTGANELSTIYKGLHSEKLTYSSQSGGISQSVTPAVNTASINMEASCKVLTAMSTIELCGLQAGASVGCINVPASSTWQNVSFNMVGPANGTTVGVKVHATTSSSGTAYVDDCYVGPARNLSQVSQAQQIGSLQFAQTSGCLWSITQTSYASDFSAQASCPAATVTGSLTSPSKTPQASYSNAQPGTYYVNFNSSMALGSNTNGECRIVDDLGNSLVSQGGSSTNQYPVSLQGSWTYTTSGNRTWKVQCYSASSTSNLKSDVGDGVAKFEVLFVPSQSQIAYKADAVPASWSGYVTNTGSGSTTSTSFVDITDTSTRSVVPITNRNFGTVTVAASQIGLNFPFPRAGNYHVCLTVTGTSPGTATQASMRLVDGTGTVINAGVWNQAQNGASQNVLCGVYKAAAPGAVLIKMQGATSAGTASFASASGVVGVPGESWEVIELDAPMPAPFFVGSVTTSSSTGQEHIERALVSSSCTSSPCTIDKSTPGFVSIIRSSTGHYTANFSASAFSDTPVCWGSGYGTTTGHELIAGDNALSSSLWSFGLSNGAGTFADGGFMIVCMGPR